MSNEQPQITPAEPETAFSDLDLTPGAAEPEQAVSEPPEELPPEEDPEEKFKREYRAIFEDGEDVKQNEPPQEKEQFIVADPDSFSAGFYDWIRCVLIAVSIVVVCLTFVFRLVEVDGKSMMDTLENADKVIVTDMFYKPHNNDIIVIATTENYDKPIIKRVIAVGGQTVKLDYDNDKLFVDGIELSEPYIKGTTFSNNGSKESNYLATDEDGNFEVPEGKLFVMGDNRAVSLDSRSDTIGLIDVKNVIGKAQFVVWPFNRFGNVYDK